MSLRNIFTRSLDIAIDGVIKADDESSLRQELEEYVLTNEAARRLSDFLDEYNNYQSANGVWISGFFGSGKSHLLKMLALVLENRQVDDAQALDLFLPKCKDDALLTGALRKAVSIPSQSILFNIDQKADVISKKQLDALLAVFAKVFDEMCGYYGKHGHVAQFERDLDSRNLYLDFKQAYQDIAGKTWEKGREQALLEGNNIAKAYSQVTGEDDAIGKTILSQYREQYSLSIEDFANQVKHYIDQQKKRLGTNEFRLNFFVDEVGQYIADNTKLMTNLQTVAESLATKCNGEAWVLVTAQEEMSSVIGEMTKQQGDDFTKIQARFANRLKLTSADVAEVIQKRLLTKTADANEQLAALYDKQCNNFKTLFDFSDGSHSYRNYQHQDHFVNCYPFVPYQFDLFQASIQGLSLHNAFEGRHSSVGERSMLGVFHQVMKTIAEHKLGDLATFDLMFEGIRAALKGQIQKAIISAERNLDSEFAIRLLKALFLVKYVKEFKPTVHNLCVLMLPSFEQPISKLKGQVEEALGLLEQQTYIQRNGELYEYLTDEEKDIEQEIKSTEVDNSDLSSELERLVFESIIKQRKIRYDSKDSNLDYPFSRKIDDKLQGREYELSINIITAFHEHTDNRSMLRNYSVYNSDELLVILPTDARLMMDLMMYKRTEKYIRQNMTQGQNDVAQRVLTSKGEQNRTRYADLLLRLQLLVGKADLMIAGADIEIAAGDAQNRVMRAFQDLIGKVYSNLPMLRGIAYSESAIGASLDASDGLFGGDATNLTEVEHELLAYIKGNQQTGIRTTIKNLVERFERKPYGWYLAAILCNLAKLCARGKLEVRSDGNLLEGDQLERTLRNTASFANVILEPQLEFSQSQLRNLKDFYDDFFACPPTANEAKALAQETIARVKDMMQELEVLQAKQSSYPFLVALQPVIDQLKELSKKPYSWYLTDLSKNEDALYDSKEKLVEPIRTFMSGPQKQIFDDARQFVQSEQPNFTYLDSDETRQLTNSLQSADSFKGNSIQQMKIRLDNLKSALAEKLAHVRQEALQTLTQMQERMQSMNEYQGLPEERQAELDRPFAELVNHVNSQGLIAVINDSVRNFQDKNYQNILGKMVQLATPKPVVPDVDYPESERPELPKIEEPAPVHLRSVRVNAYNKAWLATENDLDEYLNALRAELAEHIGHGKKVMI